MYTIISGTNREASHTEKVANEYKRLLTEMNIDADILTMVGMDVMHRTPEFLKMEKDILIPTKKFIFILPEYNGTFPGVLKAMIDNTDISKVWYHKKALLTGISSGRAGTLRGIDHLAASLHYLKMNVHYNKLPISLIDKMMDKNDRLNEETIKVIIDQLDEFINY